MQQSNKLSRKDTIFQPIMQVFVISIFAAFSNDRKTPYDMA